MLFADVRQSLAVFTEAGFVGSDLAKMMLVCPELVASPAAARNAVAVASYLATTYSLRRYDVRRIARSEPALLSINQSAILATTEVRIRPRPPFLPPLPPSSRAAAVLKKMCGGVAAWRGHGDEESKKFVFPDDSSQELCQI